MSILRQPARFSRSGQTIGPHKRGGHPLPPLSPKKFWLPVNAESPASPNDLIELPGNTGRVFADSSSAETAEEAAKQTESRALDSRDRQRRFGISKLKGFI
jgi:hypothetical protein